MLYTPKQICARNNISISTFKRKINKFGIMFKKSGQRKRFYNQIEVNFIENLLDNHKNKGQ